jgi:hypothetical protein
MTQLEKDHAEIRLSAFQIADQIFVRSHQFRDLILSDFHTFLELTAGKYLALVFIRVSGRGYLGTESVP